MSELINKAIETLKNESEKANPAIVDIGQYLIKICTTEKVANKLLKKEKCLEGALDEMRKAAKRKAVGGCGSICGKEGLEIVEGYYSIKEEDKQVERIERKDNIIDIMDLM